MPRTLASTPIFRLEGFEVRTRVGVAEYVRLRVPDWANVIALTDRDEVVLVRQHRHGIDAPTLEIPGGVVDPGESPMEAAVRELREETGYAGPAVEPLGWVWSNPAIQDNRTWMYCVRGACRVGDPQPDAGEQIEVVLQPLDRIGELLDEGVIAHALAVVPLQRLLLRRRT